MTSSTHWLTPLRLLLASIIYCLFGNQVFAASQADPIEISLTKGQLFSLVAPIAKTGGEEHVKKYYQSAFPLAQQFGLKNHGRLNVIRKIVGSQEHKVWSIFTWPSTEAEQSFVNHADWPEIKALRPLAWDELKILTAKVNEDITLRFSPDKFYTLAIARFNPENPNDYLHYLDNIEQPLNQVGGRFMYKMIQPDYEVHGSSTIPPNQVTIVEWNSADGLNQLQANDEYQEQTQLLASGLTSIELHLVQVRL
jgi:uncharacterized protein (DUF1330 family)